MVIVFTDDTADSPGALSMTRPVERINDMLAVMRGPLREYC